jgi:hypothetical protein
MGFLLGSSGAITFGLFGVAFVFWVLGPEHPELQAEVGPLMTHLARFSLLTVASAGAFYGLARQTRWRGLGIGVLALVLAAIVMSYVRELG